MTFLGKLYGKEPIPIIPYKIGKLPNHSLQPTPLRGTAELVVIGRANARPITRRSVELSRTTGYRKSDNQ